MRPWRTCEVESSTPNGRDQALKEKDVALDAVLKALKEKDAALKALKEKDAALKALK
eukprot:gene31711-6915_t